MYQPDDGPISLSPLTFTMQCGSSTLSLRLVRYLQTFDFVQQDTAEVFIVFDSPRGFAITTLSTFLVRPAHLLVATGCQCPEYLHDLLDYAPDILIFQGDLERDLPNILFKLRSGTQLEQPALPPTPLSPVERQIFRLLVLNYSNQAIADITYHSIQTIKNTVSGIYFKLGLSNRMEAYYYYWGVWNGVREVAPEQIAYPGRM